MTTEIPELAGAVIANDGAQVLLLFNTRLSMAEADRVSGRLSELMPGLGFTVIDNVSGAVVYPSPQATHGSLLKLKRRRGGAPLGLS